MTLFLQRNEYQVVSTIPTLWTGFLRIAIHFTPGSLHMRIQHNFQAGSTENRADKTREDVRLIALNQHSVLTNDRSILSFETSVVGAMQSGISSTRITTCMQKPFEFREYAPTFWRWVPCYRSRFNI